MLTKKSPSLLLAVLLLTNCFIQNNAGFSSSNFKGLLKDQGGNLGGFYGKQIEALAGLEKYGEGVKTDLEVAKTVGDAVVPIITTGMNFIPVVGPLISGIFGSLWTAFSPLMESKKEDPVQKLQRKMKDYIDQRIKDSEKRMSSTLKERFREVISKSITAKNNRDGYICDKYTEASRVFVNQMKENQSVSALQRTVVASYLDNCDNFLKDTAEGFDYPEFADSLWIPALQSTLVRLSLLAEAIYWGEELNLIPQIIIGFHYETTRDVKRQLNRFKDAMAIARKTIEETEKRYDYSEQELDACRMQAMLPYLDTSVYPKGMPKRIHDKFQFDTEESVRGAYHVQYFFSTDTYQKQDTTMNCFMGSLNTITAGESGQVDINYYMENGKGYELRLIYRATELTKWKGEGWFGGQFFNFGKAEPEYDMDPERFILYTTIQKSFCDENTARRNELQSTTLYSCYIPERNSYTASDENHFIIERVLVGTYNDASGNQVIRANPKENLQLYGIEVLQLGPIHSKLTY